MALGGPLGTEYENYSETCQTYDSFRPPIGLAFVLESLATAKPAAEVDLLDVGCGSGTYLHAIKDSVKSIQGIDLNEGMLAKARAKLPEGTRLEQGSLTDMSCFGDAAFDVAITTQVRRPYLPSLAAHPQLLTHSYSPTHQTHTTQVLHHLDQDTTNFPNVGKTCKEVSRILKPGGVWIISTGTPEQSLNGFWWAPIIPKALETISKRFPSLETLTRLLGEAGMEVVKTHVPTETLVPPELYLNLEGAFTAEYRASDSSWSLASDEELAAGLATLRAKLDAGEGDAFLAEREAARKAGGQTTLVVARKK